MRGKWWTIIVRPLHIPRARYPTPTECRALIPPKCPAPQKKPPTPPPPPPPPASGDPGSGFASSSPGSQVFVPKPPAPPPASDVSCDRDRPRSPKRKSYECCNGSNDSDSSEEQVRPETRADFIITGTENAPRPGADVKMEHTKEDNDEELTAEQKDE